MNDLLSYCMLGFGIVSSAQAFAFQPESVNLYGFVTQGYFKTSENDYYGSSKNGSFDFTEVGAGAGVNVNDRLAVSGLLLSRRAGAADNGHVRLDHLVFDINAYHDGESTAGFRLGRNKIPFGFYNATRDMAFTRPTLLLPQSNYHDHSRNFLINADGLEAYYERWGGGSHTKYNFLYEKTNGINNPQTEVYFLGMNWPGNLRPDYATGAVVDHTFNQGKTRLKAYYGHLPIKYYPGGMDPLPGGSITVDVAWLSAQQEILPKLTLTSEVFLPRIEYKGFSPFITDRSVYPLGRYIQASYAYSAEWEFYGRFDQSYRDKLDKNGEKSNAETGRPAFSAYAHDWTIGANYFPSPNLMISAEYHRIKGTAFLPVLDNANPAETRERWNMLGLQVAYKFK